MKAALPFACLISSGRSQSSLELAIAVLGDNDWMNLPLLLQQFTYKDITADGMKRMLFSGSVISHVISHS